MFLGAFLLTTEAQPPPPKAPVEQVLVQARAVEIPSLPRSPEEAQKDFAKVQEELLYAFQETGRMLASATEAWKRTGWSGARIAIAPAHEAEAQQWAPFLFDRAHLVLEEPVLSRWNDWQSALMQRGMAVDRRMAAKLVLLSGGKREVVGWLGADREGTELDVVVEEAHRPSRLILAVRPKAVWVEVMAVDRMDYRARTAFAQEASAFAQAQAALLAGAWGPLARHLNSSTRALMDLDQACPPTRDSGLLALRLRARIHFLERFRNTLWFTQVVWAHMASRKIQTFAQLAGKD